MRVWVCVFTLKIVCCPQAQISLAEGKRGVQCGAYINIMHHRVFTNVCEFHACVCARVCVWLCACGWVCLYVHTNYMIVCACAWADVCVW